MQRLIHEIREHLKVSQDDLAKMMGISYATVKRWERGHSLPEERRRGRHLEHGLYATEAL